METVGSSRKQHGRRSSDDITNVNFLSSRGRGREGRDPLSLLSSSLAWTGKPCVPCMFCVHTVVHTWGGHRWTKNNFVAVQLFLHINCQFTVYLLRVVWDMSVRAGVIPRGLELHAHKYHNYLLRKATYEMYACSSSLRTQTHTRLSSISSEGIMLYYVHRIVPYKK